MERRGGVNLILNGNLETIVQKQRIMAMILEIHAFCSSLKMLDICH